MNQQGVIRTQGIKYAGSKLKIIPYINDIIAGLNDVRTVLDGFSGTTRVSQALAQKGYQLSCNDIADWSEVFGNCFLIARKQDAFYQELIDELNSMLGYHGWFSENYGNSDYLQKMPFQLKNLRKLDAIRDQIESFGLDWEDKCVLLTSLLLALDKVDSTLGHYVSYLAKWSPRSYKELKLELPMRFELKNQHEVIKDDIFNTIQNRSFDFAYFDPPYGSNNGKMPSSRVRYQSYYHFWTTVVRHDKPELFGKVNRRSDSRDLNSVSVFEEFRKNEQDKFLALEALKKLIEQTDAHYIMLSYSSGGKATREELSEIIAGAGKLISAIDIDYRKNVMGNMRWTNEWVNSDGKYHEYLFLMEK
jgi:adenine-specific DNA-methyltransferase